MMSALVNKTTGGNQGGLVILRDVVSTGGSPITRSSGSRSGDGHTAIRDLRVVSRALRELSNPGE